VLAIGLILAVIPVHSRSFRPKWTSSTSSGSQNDLGRSAGISIDGGDPRRGSRGNGAGGERRGGEEPTCGAPYPADTAVAPSFRQKLNIPALPPPVDRSSEVDPARCTLHAPPGTSYRHGITVGFTVVARNSEGVAIPARGLPFVVNLTNSGESTTGTVFDLQNGTYFVYSTLYFSPALFNITTSQIWVRLHGQHIQGSPFEVPVNMGAISNDFKRRLEAAEKAGRSPDLGGEKGCAGDFVIVTGASSGFFDRAVNLVGSIHHWAPRVKIIFYDLGLSAVQAEDVRTWEDVEMRNFPFKQYGMHMHVNESLTRNGMQGAYSWRAPILLNVSEEHRCMLWLDSGIGMLTYADVC